MTDSLDETNETWGRRLFEPEPSPIPAVLVVIGAVAFALGVVVMGFAR